MQNGICIRSLIFFTNTMEQMCSSDSKMVNYAQILASIILQFLVTHPSVPERPTSCSTQKFTTSTGYVLNDRLCALLKRWSFLTYSVRCFIGIEFDRFTAHDPRKFGLPEWRRSHWGYKLKQQILNIEVSFSWGDYGI